MLTIYQLKPAFQNLLRPLTRTLARIGVTPNQVTLSALVLSLAAGTAVFWGHHSRSVLLLIPAVLFIRMALNAIDGMLAREHKLKSNLGAILNELGDVLSDTALYLPLAVLPGISGTLTVGVVLLAIVSEMTGVLAIQVGAQRRYDGPMGKSDRAFVFGVITLLLGSGLQAGLWVNVALGIVLVLLIFTIINRTRKALQEAQCRS